MLSDIQNACQNANPYVIQSLTEVHGVYVNVYDKSKPNEYDEGRDSYISNMSKFNENPKYVKIKLLLYDPVQETFSSDGESFDTYMKDIFIVTCRKEFDFAKEQKFEVYYDKYGRVPNRTFQSFEIREYSNSNNQFSIRKVMLKPFN